MARGRKRSDKIPDCGLVFGPRKPLGYCESSLEKKIDVPVYYYIPINY
jgi:hypothetical protein